MKKVFKKVLFVSTVMMFVGVASVMVSCKKEAKDKAAEETAEKEFEAAVENLFGGLNNSLNKALKACGEECGDDEEMEIVDFEIETDDEGEEIPVAHIKMGGEIFQIIDIDADGVFDVAVFDSDDDGEITDDEIVDISEDNITINDVAEQLGVSLDDEGGTCDSDDDDDSDGYDEEESIVERTSRDASPARQRREAAAEADLPDYVNNARVKALRKK